jgi:hypothetical protein
MMPGGDEEIGQTYHTYEDLQFVLKNAFFYQIYFRFKKTFPFFEKAFGQMNFRQMTTFLKKLSVKMTFRSSFFGQMNLFGEN